ncbi:MAG TPA: hypothetical protein PLB89_04875 [Flavobacteriales bacterium]|nr:hypothetical protein [Flavobacteriales bacterium]
MNDIGTFQSKSDHRPLELPDYDAIPTWLLKRHAWYCELVIRSKAAEILGRQVADAELAKYVSRVLTPDGKEHYCWWRMDWTLLSFRPVDPYRPIQDQDPNKISFYDYWV